MSFWDEKTETMKPAGLEKLQLKRLRHIVNYCYSRIPFYREKFRQAGLKPSDIKRLDDVERIPYTTKQDLRDNYPFKMVAVPYPKINRIHASSGTSGKPTVVVYTRGDLDVWADLMARELYMSGVRKEDTVQLIYNYAFFTGGFGFHQGAEKIGAAVIPAGVGNSRKQIQVMKDFNVSMFSSTPSYALHLAEVMDELNIKSGDLKLRVGVFGAEPWSEAMRKRIENSFGIDAFDNYGLSEMCGPGVCMECEEKCGMHIWGDHFLPEIVDPESAEIADDGELVLTTLTKEGLPLLRYKTGDITSFISGGCSCGRTHKRIARIRGRVDDMLIIKGVNVFPSHVEEIIMSFPEMGDSYQIIVSRDRQMDSLGVKIEVNPEIFTGSEVQLRDLRQALERELRSGLDVSVRVELVEPLSLERSAGKAKRVFDLRKE
ncbi:MAG: phenylacetate--CoA ligase [Candidatus Altiarchaeales archaeon ex4484_2]|nr:MAG: phenylacetate--CoA ligase [Candidatus Altiarchaeales archaeon ex4484_2]